MFPDDTNNKNIFFNLDPRAISICVFKGLYFLDYGTVCISASTGCIAGLAQIPFFHFPAVFLVICSFKVDFHLSVSTQEREHGTGQDWWEREQEWKLTTGTGKGNGKSIEAPNFFQICKQTW